MESDLVKRTLQRIKSKYLTESVFDEVAAKVSWSIQCSYDSQMVVSLLAGRERGGVCT